MDWFKKKKPGEDKSDEKVKAPPRLGIMQFAVGDRIETAEKYLRFSADFGKSILKEAGLPLKTMQSLYRSGPIRAIKYSKSNDEWLVYYDCEQTGEVETISEMWMKPFTGAKFKDNTKVSGSTIDDFLEGEK